MGKIMINISLTVNGKSVSKDVEPKTLLSSFLRENLNLTGTHIGCDTSQCGACSIHLNGKAVKSCSVLAVQADGAEVTTIEGIADGEKLHPMQEAFRENHGLQCGFCTPGMIMSSIKLVENNPKISEKPAIAPKGLMDAAAAVRRIEMLKERGLISKGEYTKEKVAIEKIAQLSIEAQKIIDKVGW